MVAEIDARDVVGEDVPVTGSITSDLKSVRDVCKNLRGLFPLLLHLAVFDAERLSHGQCVW